MKLQARFLLLFIFVFGVVALLLVFQRVSDLDRSRSVLQHELSQRHTYYKKISQVEGQPLESLSVDYSFWDEMVNFIKVRNLQFAKDNIDTGLGTYGADMAWVYRSDDSLVYYKSAKDDPALTNLALPRAFFQKLYADHFAHFFVQEPSGLLEIRAATVHPGDDSARLTPPQGFWLVGRYWDKAHIAVLGDLTQSTMTLAPPGSNTGDQLFARSVSFGIDLTGWDGRPVAVLDSTAQVPLAGDLETIYIRQLTLLLIVTVATLLVIVLSIWRLVLRPVGLITTSLRDSTPHTLDELVKQHTEFGNLAKTAQSFFTSEFLKNKLVELNTAKSEFLAIAAHELKGPVGNVHLFAENLADLLKQGTSKDDLLSEVSRISQQAHRATVLINDIYQASKGGQALEMQRSDFDFDAFIRREVEDAQYSTHQKIILEGSTGRHITSDIDRLGQVMTNLIRNASKYSPKADKIIIRLGYEANLVTVEVQDFGLGISTQDQARLFERFFRSKSVATSYPGLGLGLSICKEIVEALGGTIWLTSELGQGSHFYVSLPVSPGLIELS